MENKKDKKWYLQLEVLAIVFAVLSLVFLILALPYVPSIFEKEMADYIRINLPEFKKKIPLRYQRNGGI